MKTFHYVTKRLLLVAALFFIYPVMTHCENLVPVVIDEHDKKEIIERLEELKVRREQAKMFQAIIDRDMTQDQREKELCAREVGIIGQERDNWKEKAESYKKAYEDAMKGRSKKCWVLKVCTAGLARCN
jgi:hypothetical protein